MQRLAHPAHENGPMSLAVAVAVARRRLHQRAAPNWWGRLLRRPAPCSGCGQAWPCPSWWSARAAVLVHVNRMFAQSRSGWPR